MTGQEILEGITAGRKEWDALAPDEWAAVYAWFRQLPGTLEHTIENMDRGEIQAAAATLNRIKGIMQAAGREQWEHITANELLEKLNRACEE